MDREKASRKPFLLRPAGKAYLWGGNRLNDEFAKEINMAPLAETWECSTHPEGPSLVSGGEFDGQSLRDVLKNHPDYLGSHPNMKGELPILIKLIDANRDLSIQVHPDDDYAGEYEGGQFGKSEMWYVLDATEDAKLVYGLKNDETKDSIRSSIRDGSIERLVKKYPIRKNDVFFLEAGTIHAIGAGSLVAEIQENSDLTYRLYDYDRVDKNGCKRELHVEKALDVATLRAGMEPRQPMRVLNYRPGVATELLCRCKYFEVHRMLVNTENNRQIEYRADSLSFRVLLCISGGGRMDLGGEKIEIKMGDCIFIPADSIIVNLQGEMQFLDVRG